MKKKKGSLHVDRLKGWCIEVNILDRMRSTVSVLLMLKDLLKIETLVIFSFADLFVGT